jgi:hypothetical protein
MDKLQELINTFSEDDKREFRIFINRQKSKKQRKDLDLFELISEQIPAKTIQEKLYKTPNKVAYHTLRKRLLKHLTDFIVLKQIDDDTTATSSITGLISLATYLFKKQSDDLGWRFLLKAEQTAIENEQYELLNNIYHIQLKKVDSEFAPNINDIYKKWRINKDLFIENEKANIGYNFIKKELNDIKIKGEDKDLEKVITTLLKKYELNDLVLKRPQILYKVLDLTRRVMLSKKDFYSFEPYIIKTYEELNNTHGFSKRNHFYKINILYMIAHILYRNRKFEKSNTYLELMHNNMHKYNNAYYQHFFSKYIQLKAANYSYLNKNEQSIELLTNIKSTTIKKMLITDQLNSKINLCVYYFNQSLFKDANNIIQTFNHSDAWLEKKMGKEWVLKKNLIEIIIQYELGNIDIVLNRIRAFNRSFSSLYKQKIFQRVQEFIEFLKLLIDKPEAIKTADFQISISGKLINRPQEQEDLQAMAFYCWMKSKMINQKYYNVLLDVVHELDEYPALK